MKDKYILIAYKPEEDENTHCSCCRGIHYSGDFEMDQFDNTDDLANQIAEYAIQNTQFDEDEGKYNIWIIFNGECIIGDAAWGNGHNPSVPLIDAMDFEYEDDDDDYDENVKFEAATEKLLEELDDKIGKLWRNDAEKKKEKERLKAEEKKKKAADAKIARKKEKERQDREKLKELAKKYPEELSK